MGLLVLQREVAGVVGDAEVRVDEPLGRFLGAELFEETQRLGGVLGMAERLRFEREAQVRAR